MTDTLPEPVARLISATNAGNLEEFLDTFASDGVVDDWGRKFSGRSAIQGWSDSEYLGRQVTLDVTSVDNTPTGTVVAARVGGNGFNGPSTFTFTVSDDAIDAMVIRE